MRNWLLDPRVRREAEAKWQGVSGVLSVSALGISKKFGATWSPAEDTSVELEEAVEITEETLVEGHFGHLDSRQDSRQKKNMDMPGAITDKTPETSTTCGEVMAAYQAKLTARSQKALPPTKSVQLGLLLPEPPRTASEPAPASVGRGDSEVTPAAAPSASARKTTRANKTRTKKERGLDAYFTPSFITRALMGLEKLPHRIFDPCCGDGAIRKILEAAGHEVYGADIKDYGYSCTIRDYLDGPSGWQGEAIVTNPPYGYGLAEKFARKVIQEAPYIALLLRIQFMTSQGRQLFLKESPPSRIWNSSRRFNMHQHGYEGKKSKSSNMDFAWYIWDRGSADHGKIDVFDWKDFEDECPM